MSVGGNNITHSRNRLWRLERILTISRELSSTLSTEGILEHVVHVAPGLVDCEVVGVFLLNEETNDLRLVAITHLPNQLLDLPFSMDDSIMGAAFAGAQSITVNRAADESPFDPRISPIPGLAPHSVLAVPLSSRDRKLGVIGAFNVKSKQGFSALDTEALTTLADHAAVAIENARRYERAQEEITAHSYTKIQLQQDHDHLEAHFADRMRQVSALSVVSAIATRSQDLETLLNESLSQVMAALDCPTGAVLLFVEDKAQKPTPLQVAAHYGMPPDLVLPAEMIPSETGLIASVRERGRPLVISDVATDLRVPAAMRRLNSQTMLVAPLCPEGHFLGIVGLLRSSEHAFNAEEVSLLATISDLMGVAVKSHRLRQFAQQSALLEERHRLARDLHDSVTQALYGVTLFAKASQGSIRVGNLSLTSQYIDRLSETARQALKEMRLLIFELRPALLEEIGLIGALQQRMEVVERRAGVAVEFQVKDVTELPSELESHVYQIAQEALNNILKHSGATRVALRLTMEQALLRLAIEDNGKGFDPALSKKAAGFGLASMRERAERVGGRLGIDSKPGAGTRLSLTVPLSSDERERAR